MRFIDRTDGEHYDADEVEAAITGLSAEERRKLRERARYWVWKFRLDRVHHNEDDLWAETITRLLDGRRQWRRVVPLVAQLSGMMESIANHWREFAERRSEGGLRVVRQTAFRPRLEDGEDAFDPLARAPWQEPDAERVLIAKDELEAFVRDFLRHFVGDRPAIVAMAGLGWGMTGPEIRACHGLSPEELEAAVKRVRRYARRWRAGKGG